MRQSVVYGKFKYFLWQKELLAQFDTRDWTHYLINFIFLNNETLFIFLN